MGRSTRRLVASVLLLASAGFGCASDTEPGPVTFTPPSVDDVSDSIVRIVGFGCGAPALGSGFAVEPHLIVTSGHLVTGRDPDSLGVIRPDGAEAAARLVAFDLDFDLAVLRVDDIEFTPVTLRTDIPSTEGVAMAVKDENDVVPIEFTVERPVNVNWDGVFRDTESRFHGLQLLADIERGDSGSGLFVSATDVIGLVHSTSRNVPGRGYAVSGRQITEYLDTVDAATELIADRCA